MRTILLLVFLVAAQTAAAQTAPDFSQGITNLGPQPAANTDWEQRNRSTQTEAEAALEHKPEPGAYTLGGGDRIRMTVFGEDDLTGQYDVDGTGTLALPLIGNVNVLGKTPRQTETLITNRYSQGYLVNPRISIEVLNFRPFFILGEVAKPGSYPYVNNLTVINAVALAGGYTPRASTGSVLIRRAADPKHQEAEAPEDAKVFPGDVLRIEERFF